MPPSSLTCPRDYLTSYAGLVTRYRVGDQSVTLTIETDWDTTETVTAPRPGAPGSLLRGIPMTAADRDLVESGPGRLHADMRVVAWVCADGKTPVVLDWQPPPTTGTTQAN